MKTWTKKNVEKLTMSELLAWNEKIVPDLRKAHELNLVLEKSQKAYDLIQAELKKRLA